MDHSIGHAVAKASFYGGNEELSKDHTPLPKVENLTLDLNAWEASDLHEDPEYGLYFGGIRGWHSSPIAEDGGDIEWEVHAFGKVANSGWAKSLEAARKEVTDSIRDMLTN